MTVSTERQKQSNLTFTFLNLKKKGILKNENYYIKMALHQQW